MEYSTSPKEASTKLLQKQQLLMNIWLLGRRVDHCGIARFILRLSSRKNRQAAFAFAELCSYIYATYNSCTSRTYASDYGCTRIFFSFFNTSHSRNDNIFIGLSCRALLRMYKPSKSNAFVQIGSEGKGVGCLLVLSLAKLFSTVTIMAAFCRLLNIICRQGTSENL